MFVNELREILEDGNSNPIGASRRMKANKFATANRVLHVEKRLSNSDVSSFAGNVDTETQVNSGHIASSEAISRVVNHLTSNNPDTP